MKKINTLIIIAALFIPVLINAQGISPGKLAHTFSIVARDAETGEIGVAVQSHWFAVGSDVSWAEAGVGAVATQSFINPDIGPEALKLMKRGIPAPDVLDTLMARDPGRDFRQVAIIDRHGRVAAHTGSKCIAFASNIVGDQFSVQANMMLNDRVVPAMKKAFLASTGHLADRLMEALQAAQNAEGDIRGQQSAAILVVSGTQTGKVFSDKIVDIRVDDHPQAIKEIARVLKTQRAFMHMSNGDLAVEKGDTKGALREYAAAEKMFPENLEMKYWRAIAMVNAGMLDEALPVFKEVFARDINWKILTPRLISNGILIIDSKGLMKISSQ